MAADDERESSRARPGLSNPGYEIFVLALSVLSLVNLVLLVSPWPLDGKQKNVIWVVDAILTAVFLSDFTYRILSADSKRRYFFRDRAGST